MSRLRTASPYLLAALLVGAGTTHFAKPGFYDPMIPSVLPGSARQWTYGSGVVELLLGALVAVPRTRRPAALASAGLFVVVLPGNVKAAVDADTTLEQVVTVARLPLQVPLVLWAWTVGRRG